MTIRDFKGRIYTVIEIGRNSTLLRCEKTGDSVRIRSYGWNEIGFIKQ